MVPLVLATLPFTTLTWAVFHCTSAPRSLGCADPLWIVYDGDLHCTTSGSKSCVIELAGSGSSSYAHQQLSVVPNVPCQISGRLYSPATCVGTCTPLVVVCPGKYTGELQDRAPVVANVVMHA